MSEDVQKLLFELKEAIILSKRVVWEWAPSYYTFKPLPHRISWSIETACQNLVRANQKFLNYFAYFALNYFTKNFTKKKYSSEKNHSQSKLYFTLTMIFLRAILASHMQKWISYFQVITIT